jgi:photosynthetic reaction center cytochrome c subunit
MAERFHRLSQRLVLLAIMLVLVSLTAVRAHQQAQAGGQRGAQAPAAPAGPLAPEKYKDIQVLGDVPADQLELTMRYFVAATGFQCQSCHVRDQATGDFAYEKNDVQRKATAREMINLVKTVNAGNFGARINCGTCHAGQNRPPGLTLAQMLTPAQIAATAARQGGPGAAGQQAPPAAAAAGQPGAGRGQQPPAPPLDDVVQKYLTALGGAAALEKLQSRELTGTLTNRAGQTMGFTIEEKGVKFRETDQVPAAAMTIGFDGTSGWTQNGDRIADLTGFPLQQTLRVADLTLPLHLKEKFPNLQAGRPTRIALGAPGSAPIDVNLIQGSAIPGTTEQWYFDLASGLLLRRRVTTRTALNGSLVEQYDYADYRAVAGVQMPYQITRANWNTLDTLKVTDIRVNTPIDDAKFVRPKG